MNEPAEVIDYKGLKILIYQDENPVDPREWDNFGTMIAFHPRYDIGDKHDLTKESLLKLVKQTEVVSLPLYLLDHSGLRISTGKFVSDSAGWDTSLIGFIYATKERILDEFDGDVERAQATLQAEVELYDDYLTGNVYGYTVMDGDHMVDSIWGYYGDPKDSGLIDEAKSAIDDYLTKKQKYEEITNA